jgi:hypothetical protein
MKWRVCLSDQLMFIELQLLMYKKRFPMARMHVSARIISAPPASIRHACSRNLSMMTYEEWDINRQCDLFGIQMVE